MKNFRVRMPGSTGTGTDIKAESMVQDASYVCTRFADEHGQVIAVVMHAPGMVITEEPASPRGQLLPQLRGNPAIDDTGLTA